MIIPAEATPQVQAAFRDVWAKVTPWVGAGNIDLHQRRFLNAGRAVGDFDFITKQDLVEAIAGLSTGTSTAARIKELLIFDTHANRANYAPEAYADRLYVEGDRLAVYGSTIVAGVRTWKHLTSYMVGSSAGRPGDLGTYDEGFSFVQIDATAGDVVWQWSGALWHFVSGMLRGALSAIPAAADANIGAFYEATDFARVYRSTGASWVDAPGQPERYQVALFHATPGTGWSICDGTNASYSTAAGGTTSLTKPNLLDVAHRYMAGAGSVGAFGAANLTIDVVNTTSGAPSATTTVDNDGVVSTVAVASATHTHDTNPAAVVVTNDPLGWAGLPYVRL